jgi:DNA mismatch repair protein MSH6
MDRSKPGAAQPKKQVTLKNWFDKSSNASKATNKVASASQFASKTRSEPKTPESQRIDVRALNSSAVKSAASSEADFSAADTPPTSDAIDVDMLSAEEMDESARSKRVSICSSYHHIVPGFGWKGNRG